MPVLGIIGAGQLARMMAHAATDLGVGTRVLSRDPEASATSAAEVVVGDWDDPAAVVAFAETCTAVTFDHELVGDAVLEALSGSGARVRPHPAAMRRASDKVEQRSVAPVCGLATAPHRLVRSAEELTGAARDLGLPVVVKRARGGYDGRGIQWVRDHDELRTLCAEGVDDVHVVEPDLAIEAELAITVARRADGSAVAYPAVETHQRDGTCRTVLAPAILAPGIDAALRTAALAIAAELDHVGVLSLEVFVVEGELLLNELAPRPHNSAHYTIDACATSQFENHVRAVLDLPLGPTEMVVPAAAMENLIAVEHGQEIRRDLVLPGGTTIHLYDKPARPGRKVGHLTAVGSDPAVLRAQVSAAADHLLGARVAPGLDRCPA